MNRTPLLLSVIALVVAVVALVVAVLVPGPQGPKGDTGPQGVQGVQGPPSSLSVERQVCWLRAGATGGQACTPANIDLDVGDVLQGYVTSSAYCSRLSCTKGRFDYRVDIDVDLDSTDPDSPDYLEANLGTGEGGTSFCYVAEVTGIHSLHVWYEDLSPVLDGYPSGFEEYVPVVYWIQKGAE